jgi:hypothetical protein
VNLKSSRLENKASGPRTNQNVVCLRQQTCATDFEARHKQFVNDPELVFAGIRGA